jgi:hypothetical protein
MEEAVGPYEDDINMMMEMFGSMLLLIQLLQLRGHIDCSSSGITRA